MYREKCEIKDKMLRRNGREIMLKQLSATFSDRFLLFGFINDVQSPQCPYHTANINISAVDLSTTYYNFPVDISI